MHYEYSDGYGSHEFSIRQPEKLGHDHLPVTSAHLVNEGRSLFLEIPALQTAMQMHLRLHLTFKDGVKFSTEMFPTVVRLGEAFTGFPNARPLVAGKADFITLRIFDPAPVKKKETPKNDKGREILIKGVTGLRYDTLKIKAKAGERLTITMKNTDPAMPHNWVLVKPAGYQKVGNASMQMLADPKAAQKHYVPDSPDVIVHTSVVNPGQSDSITFNAPTTPGEYPYMCTYPGHWALMKGLLVVY